MRGYKYLVLIVDEWLIGITALQIATIHVGLLIFLQNYFHGQ